MFQPIVFIIFYSRCGSTEKLALAAAVGATQARGLIRLRRVKGGAYEETPECRETLKRMHREYIPPNEKDVLNADAIVLASPAGFETSSPEWKDFFDLLARLGSEGRLKGKVAAVIDAGNSFSSRMMELGFVVAPSSLDALSAGRSVVELAQEKRL